LPLEVILKNRIPLLKLSGKIKAMGASFPPIHGRKRWDFDEE